MCPGGLWVAVAWLGAVALPAAATAAVEAVMLPSDMGATCIDVSGYPKAFQRTYHDLFLTKCTFCHTAARAINAPYLEVPKARLQAYATTDPPSESAQGVQVSDTIWREYVSRMWRRPPCCNRCPTFTRAEAIRLWDFLVYDSLHRKTGPNAVAWARHRRNLLARFAQRTGGHDDHDRDSSDALHADRLGGAGESRAAVRARGDDQSP